MPEQVTDRLWWSDNGDEALVLVGSEATRQPVLSFRARGHRLSLCMVMLDGRRTVDASFHPAVATQLLESHARQHRADPNGWIGATTTALLQFGRRHRLWVGGGGDSCDQRPALTTLLGGMTHPILGAAYEHGTATLEEVPRWASPMLAMPTPQDCARQVFGRSATRPVVAALAAALAPATDSPALAMPAMRSIAYAVAASATCEADHLVPILRAGDGRPGPAEWPSRTTISMLATIADQLPSKQTSSLFVEALDAPDGPVELLKAASVFRQVTPLFERAPSARLDRFVRECLALASLDPGPTARAHPEPEARPRRRRPPQGARPHPTPTRAASGPAVARRPPAAPRLRPDPARRAFLEPERFVYRPEVFALHDVEVGDYRLTLPRSAIELLEWSRILKNCLDDYPRPIAEGRSVVFGLRRREGLVGAIEYRPDQRRIHQAEAAGGRPLDKGLLAKVAGVLAQHGLVEP